MLPIEIKQKFVAPLAGSVDRNLVLVQSVTVCVLSLPSRGAWIEISVRTGYSGSTGRSLPSRGAWIEMLTTSRNKMMSYVAPLAGSVDRNSS